MIGISLISPASICADRSSRDTAEVFLLSASIFLLLRLSARALASFSSSNARNRSPAAGTSLRPMISTGVDGPALLSSLPFSSVILRILPNAVPTTTGSPWCNVPPCTSNVATGPLPLSSFASITVPEAILEGFACSSCTSATVNTVSSRSLMPSPFFALV